MIPDLKAESCTREGTGAAMHTHLSATLGGEETKRGTGRTGANDDGIIGTLREAASGVLASLEDTALSRRRIHRRSQSYDSSGIAPNHAVDVFGADDKQASNSSRD